jgi:hypothetical protein
VTWFFLGLAKDINLKPAPNTEAEIRENVDADAEGGLNEVQYQQAGEDCDGT